MCAGKINGERHDGAATTNPHGFITVNRIAWFRVNPFRRLNVVLFVLLGIIAYNIQLSAAISPGLDLSYQGHLDKTILATAVKNHLVHLSKQHNDGLLNIELDISNSNLGNEGSKEIADVLFMAPNSDVRTNSNTSMPSRIAGDHYTSKPVSLSLILRMNRITHSGATFILKKLLIGSNSTINNEVNDRNYYSSSVDQTLKIHDLDLSWNNLNKGGEHSLSCKEFRKSLQRVIGDSSVSPRHLHLDNCCLGPATCRSIAKGIVSHFEDNRDRVSNNSTVEDTNIGPTPISLYLCGNKEIGDAGAAALAAAIRTIVSSAHEHGSGEKADIVVFENLDLSACDIGDIGAQALALALEECSGSISAIHHLDLSNNRIGDQGALCLGSAIQSLAVKPEGGCSLDLSGNKDITDRGISTILSAIEQGKVRHIALRSCTIGADGTEQLGRSLRAFVFSNDSKQRTLNIDLSGNPLGVLRGKSKAQGSKYSASMFTSKATSTAASYVNTGMSFLKKAGLSFPSSVESDDEEKPGEDAGMFEGDLDPSRARCAFKSLSNAFVEEVKHKERLKSLNFVRKIKMGLRHAYCDSAGANALAAMLVVAKDEMNGKVALEIDLDLNPIIDEDMIEALHGKDDYKLRDMAERHNEAMRVIREAQERAAKAAMLAKMRIEAEAETSGFGGRKAFAVVDDWDSDADYEEGY